MAIIKGKHFDVEQYFEVQELIGEGAYGVVCAARSKATGEAVAIKKISPFEHTMLCLRTLREMKLLRYFRHENISCIVGAIQPPTYDTFTDVYLVQELMETDMHRIIRSQKLSDDHCQYFLYQILRGLHYIHSARVLHRDLKPSNLLVNSNCDLKICDFGLARAIDVEEETSEFMTEYVATRWYRAPEIMLSYREYTQAVDVWSVGCILAEMLLGKPLFPGRDYLHQLNLILDVLGTPNNEYFNSIKSAKAKEYLQTLMLKPKIPFTSIFPEANPLSLDLLDRLLTFDPKHRITVFDALRHPYLAPYHDPNDEPTAEPIPAGFFSFDRDKENLSKEDLKSYIYQEVVILSQPIIQSSQQTQQQQTQQQQQPQTSH